MGTHPDTYDYSIAGAGSRHDWRFKFVPVTPPPQVRGVNALWAADASIMPAVTSANTNTPSMMVGHQAASFIAA